MPETIPVRPPDRLIDGQQTGEQFTKKLRKALSATKHAAPNLFNKTTAQAKLASPPQELTAFSFPSLCRLDSPLSSLYAYSTLQCTIPNTKTNGLRE
jgi:hypothetical protein